MKEPKFKVGDPIFTRSNWKLITGYVSEVTTSKDGSEYTIEEALINSHHTAREDDCMTYEEVKKELSYLHSVVARAGQHHLLDA